MMLSRTTGFGDRLLNEVKKIALKDIKIKIYAPPERKYSTWIGGSILANLATFKKVCRLVLLRLDLTHLNLQPLHSYLDLLGCLTLIATYYVTLRSV